MSDGFGIETPGMRRAGAHRAAARYLVIIDAAGTMVARLFTQAREPSGEFDAGTEEVALMLRGLAPTIGALGTDWDRGLQGHSAAERARAEVYALDL